MDEISEKFKQLSDMLLDCEKKGKKCKKCKQKDKCMRFLRITLGAVCMMFIQDDQSVDGSDIMFS